MEFYFGDFFGLLMISGNVPFSFSTTLIQLSLTKFTMRLRTVIFIFTFIVISLTGSVLVSDRGSKMYPTGSKSEDRKSFLDPEENELVEVDLDDPWVRREDYKPKKCTHVQGTRGEKLKLKQERNKNISQKFFSVVTKLCVTNREEKNPKDFRRRLSVRSLFLCKKPCHSD